MAKSARIEIRVTEGEKAAWAEAAGGPRRVSEWLRAMANTAAFKEEPTPIGGKGSEILVPEPKIREEAKATSQCPRFMHHRPGTYCGSCQKVQ